MTTSIARGAHILLRDAVCRLVRIDQTSTGRSAWRSVGVSEIVRDQDAIFLGSEKPPHGRREYAVTVAHVCDVTDGGYRVRFATTSG